MFQNYLRLNNITFYTSSNYDVKCAVVERLIKTLKSKLYRYMTANNTDRYVDVLQDLAHSYNSAYHSTIKTAPILVDIHNEAEILRRLYGTHQRREKTNYYKNDAVRLSQLAGPFEKSYRKGWTDEIFIISDVIPTSPPTYMVQDLRGETIVGKFYSEELQKIKNKRRVLREDEYEIEKIIATRKRKGKTQYLVRWKGYDQQHDSWVDYLISTGVRT